MLPTDVTAVLPTPDHVALVVDKLRSSSSEFDALVLRYSHAAPALRHFRLMQWQGNIAIAIEAFRAALALTPEDPDLWRHLAAAYDGAQQSDLAELCVTTSLRFQPRSARSWLLLANLNSRAGQVDDAEQASNRAIDLDAALGDAHFGSSLPQFRRRQLAAASASVKSAIAHGYANGLGYATVGHILNLAGDFRECADAFAQAERFAVPDTNTRRKKSARALTYQAMIEGDPVRAMADYPALAGPEGEDPEIILRDGFSLLSAYGHTAAAIAVGRLRLAQDPEDPIQRYLLDAVSGRSLPRAPSDYLEHYFDRCAASFDQKLVEVLQYDAPVQMARLLEPFRTACTEVLDLGCGTGLAAAHLAAFGGALTGIDISSRMLEEAAKRGPYGSFVKAEAVDYLAAHEARFDLIFAADVLVYFGDLEPLFDGVAAALAPDALFANHGQRRSDPPAIRPVRSRGSLHRAAQRRQVPHPVAPNGHDSPGSWPVGTGHVRRFAAGRRSAPLTRRRPMTEATKEMRCPGDGCGPPPIPESWRGTARAWFLHR